MLVGRGERAGKGKLGIEGDPKPGQKCRRLSHGRRASPVSLEWKLPQHPPRALQDRICLSLTMPHVGSNGWRQDCHVAFLSRLPLSPGSLGNNLSPWVLLVLSSASRAHLAVLSANRQIFKTPQPLGYHPSTAPGGLDSLTVGFDVAV